MLPLRSSFPFSYTYFPSHASTHTHNTVVVFYSFSLPHHFLLQSFPHNTALSFSLSFLLHLSPITLTTLTHNTVFYSFSLPHHSLLQSFRHTISLSLLFPPTNISITHSSIHSFTRLSLLSSSLLSSLLHTFHNSI